MASRSSNRAAVPEAKSALDRFKYEGSKRDRRTFKGRLQR